MSQASAVAPRPIARVSWATLLAPSTFAWLILAVMSVVVLATFRDYGISWDEWLQNTYGVMLLDYYRSGFRNEDVFNFVNLFLYGGFFDLTAAILNLVSPFSVYDTRHLLGGVIFVSGLFAGWKLTKLLAGERAALIALACLATTPLLYGHGFINPKDSPLAWFGIWTAYYSCRILGTEGRISWGTVVGFGVSLGLTVGTRVIGIAYLDYLALVLVVAAVARLFAGETPRMILQRVRAASLPMGAGLLLAFVVMAVFWPWSVQEPLNFLAALRTFEHFAFYPMVLWNGEYIRADVLPVTYLPGLLALQLPEYVLVGLVPALITGVLAVRRRILTVFAEPRAQQYAYVIGCAAAPLAGYLVMNPTIYNGLRHFLFVAPPLVILGAIGLDKLITLASAKFRVGGMVLAGILALGIARQSVLMAELHPYEYLSYNSFIGGIKGAVNRFELDYWGTSLAESARGLAATMNKDPSIGLSSGVTAKVFGCGDRTSTEAFLPHGTKLTEDITEADFYLEMTGVRCLNPPRHGKVVYEVKRRGVTLGSVIDIRPPKE